MYIHVWAAGRPVLYISWSHHDYYIIPSQLNGCRYLHTIIITMHSLVYIAL